MKLEIYLKKNGIKAKCFAERIGVQAGTMSRYVNGTRVPRPEILIRIAEESRGKVTANDFILNAQARVI